MIFKVVMMSQAQQDLLALDRNVATRIAEKLRYFISQKNPLRFAKRLTRSPLGNYRFRVGDYRVLFDVDSRGATIILVVLSIKHRREAYD